MKSKIAMAFVAALSLSGMVACNDDEVTPTPLADLYDVTPAFAADTCSAQAQQLSFKVEILKDAYKYTNTPEDWTVYCSKAVYETPDGKWATFDTPLYAFPDWAEVKKVDANNLTVNLAANNTANVRTLQIVIKNSASVQVEAVKIIQRGNN